MVLKQYVVEETKGKKSKVYITGWPRSQHQKYCYYILSLSTYENATKKRYIQCISIVDHLQNDNLRASVDIHSIGVSHLQ